MIFDVYCMSQVLSGNKTVTRRMPMPSGERPAIPGQRHCLKVGRTKKCYGLINIVSCELEKIGDLTDEEAVREGFNNKEHYMNYFRHLNGDVEEDQLVWRVEFKLL